jgi:hypothetical protein
MPYNWPDIPTCSQYDDTSNGLQPIESEHGLDDTVCQLVLAYRVVKAFDQGPACGVPTIRYGAAYQFHAHHI